MHEKFNRNVQKSILLTETYTNILFLMKTKNGHILTFSEKMQISAILCFITCDWFCPMTSHFMAQSIIFCLPEGYNRPIWNFIGYHDIL